MRQEVGGHPDSGAGDQLHAAQDGQTEQGERVHHRLALLPHRQVGGPQHEVEETEGGADVQGAGERHAHDLPSAQHSAFLDDRAGGLQRAGDVGGLTPVQASALSPFGMLGEGELHGLVDERHVLRAVLSRGDPGRRRSECAWHGWTLRSATHNDDLTDDLTAAAPIGCSL